jgi:hypothetical protein
VYSRGTGDTSIIVGVYGDDLVITGAEKLEVHHFKEDMKRLFSMSDCRGDDLWGAPRARQYAGWRPRNPRGFSTRRPAPLEGPVAPAAG